MKKILTLLLIILLAGCSKDTSELPYSEFINDENPEVTIDFENYGKITVQLFPDVAPNTVNNFLTLATDDFYVDTTIHRVIKDFVIQGGDPEGNGLGGAGYNIPGEFKENGYTNDLTHSRGVISMARSQVFDSASSQFFIVHQDSDFLDEEYAGFGAVVKGLDVLDEIASVESTNDTPNEPVTIKSIEVTLNDYVIKDVNKVEELSEEFYLPGEYRNVTNTVVSILFSDDQEIQIELFDEVAPISVANFLSLIEEGFYDDLTMHRIINGFMIQGGDPDGTGSGGSNETIKGEFKSNGVSNNLSHVRGVISMARSTANNSASSQFFIVHMDSTFLDGAYAAFGAVLTGFETLDYIATVDVDANDKPLEPIVIKSITIIN